MFTLKRLLKTALCAAVFLASSLTGRALDINIAVSALENGVGLSNGADSPAGNLLRIGYFAVDPGNSDFTQLADSEITANKFNFDYLRAHFVQFGPDFFTGQIAGAPDPNYASSQFFAYNTAAPGNFIGKNIYLMAFGASTAPASGPLPAGVELGVFKSSATFPSGADEFSTEGALSLTVAEVPAGNILLGGFGNGTVDPAGVSPGGAPLFNLTSLTPSIRFQSATYTVAENGATATITLARDGNPAGAFTVEASTSNGTAVAGEDYTAITSQVVTFADQATTATFNVTLTDDSAFEGNETVNLSLANPSLGAVLGSQTTAVLTITENDANPAGEFNFSATAYQGSENASADTTVTITVTRTGGQGGAVSVEVAVAAGGSATVGDDFTLPATPVTLNWADQDTAPKTFDITIKTDAVVEAAGETINLALQNATNGGSIGTTQATATVNILDADNQNPTVVITTPKENAKITGANAVISGTAADNLNVARVEVSLNGGAPQQATLGGTATARTWNLTTIPEQGANTLTVTAFDQQNNASTAATRTFTFVNVRPGLAGSYNGLLKATGASVAPIQNHGLLTVKVLPTGAFTGKITIGGIVVPLSGTILTGGEARFGKTFAPNIELIKKAKPANLSFGRLALTLDVNAGNRMTGTLKDGAGVTTLGVITNADKAPGYHPTKNPVPQSLLNKTREKGKYTSLFLADAAPNNGVAANGFPQGDGFGAVTISPTGTVKVVGKLADGSAVVYVNAISASGNWPVYVPLYKKTGFLAGDVQFDDTQTQTDASGDNLIWFKVANAKDKFYPNGWPDGITTDFIASKFLAPTKPTTKNPTPPNSETVLGPGLPPAANATTANIEIALAAGALTTATSNDGSIDAKSKVAVLGATAGQTAATALKIGFVAPTGAMKGTFTHPGTGKALPFLGTAFQKTNSAGGYFLFLPPKTAPVGTPAESGRVAVTEKP